MKKKLNNRWKLPLIIGAGVLGFISILAVTILVINSAHKKDIQQILEETKTEVIHDGHQSCHIDKGTIIDLGDTGMLSYRNQSFVKNVNIPAGHYKVTLESYDGYNTRAQTDPAGQQHEQYRVKFRKGSEVVATSGVTTDLKDLVTRDRKITVVNNDLNISKNIDNLYVEHAFQNATGPNSLRAVCMSLESIAQPIDGRCGPITLTGNLYDSAPTENLCSAGIPTSVTETSDETRRIWSWVCQGEDGGDDSSECRVYGKALPVCGDGIVNQDNEECDNGKDVNGVVPEVGYGETAEYCKSDCTKGVVTGGQCGNGTIEGDEECDDGNTQNGDGCDSSCQKENGAIRLTKTVSKDVVKSGDSVVYSYRIENTSTVTLSGISLSDDKLGTISCPETSLAAGAVMTCTKTTNIYNGVTNRATVSAKDVNGETVSDVDSATVRIESEPEPEDDDDDEEDDPDCDSSIGNYIWYDTNGNGVQEDIEEGISGIKVCAFNGNRKYCDKTNKNGKYKIDDLCPGTYTVIVKDVGGMVQTYDPDGKLDNKTRVKLKSNDKHTKADFGYRGSAPQTGVATNIALLIGISTLITIGMLLFMRKKGRI